MRFVLRVFMQCLFALILALPVCPVPAQAQSADFRLKAVVKTGDLVPGDSLHSFRSFSESQIDSTGELAFYGLTSSLLDGIWFRDVTGNLSLLGIRGGTAPVLSGVLFDDIFDVFKINNARQVVFGSSLKGASVTTSNDIALWLRNGDGTISLIAREGDAAPGWSGTPPFTGSFNRYDLSESGKIVFNGYVNLGPGPVGDIIRDGIWLRDSAGTLSLAVRYGDTAPGAISTFWALGTPELTGAGQLIFEARATLSGGDHGVWSRDTAGNITAVALEGDSAPGISGAVLGKTGTSSTPRLRKVVNGAGSLALFSIISGTGVTGSNDHALWLRDTAGTFTLIAREGGPAPGTSAGITYAALLGTDSEPVTDVPVLNNTGQILFSASLTGPGVASSNDEGIWFWNGSGTPTLVARKGDQVPGTPAGTVIAGFPTRYSSTGMRAQINDTGDVLLAATLTGPGVDVTNDQCLIFWSGTVGMNLLLREGDSVYIGPGDTRIVRDFLEEGYPGLNNSDQIAISVGFGSSYAFVLAAPNSLPASHDTSVTTNKNAAYQFAAADFPFTDADAGDSLQQIQIKSLPGQGNLKLGGVTVAADDVILKSSLDSGSFVFTPVSGTSGVPYTTFQFAVHDGTAYSAGASTMTVNVINALPASHDNSITAEQNILYTFLASDFPFSDADTGDSLQQIRITALPGQGQLKLGGTAIAVNDVISQAALAAGSFTFIPAANTSGIPYTTFQFKVSDGTAYSAAPYTMTVNVLNTPWCDPATCGPVAPLPGIAVVFTGGVTAGGQTTASISAPDPDTGSCPGAANFTFGLNILSQSCYDIHTTATFSGSVQICLTYDDTGLTIEQEEGLTIQHMESGVWQNRTIPPVDTVNNIVCGSVSSFSWFVIGYDKTPPTFTLNRLTDTLWPPNHKLVEVAEVTNVNDGGDPSPKVDIQVTSRDVVVGKDKEKDDEKDNHGQKNRDDADYDKDHHTPDWEVRQHNGIWEVWVRAELSERSKERIYTITATVTDKSGNKATESHTVRVLHDKGKRK